ncbi:Brp/Blh family beta-carotene 15,15'-dioxygenase [Flavobacterium sp. N2820]|uniref:Brp/Blh family beta-carotene 15,15'-dioxygenase n=1 Tax=Flavobacterium sp. N2820 TaxID=2986834 RepID=UPI00222479CA|nr:Brp/Blh family beta-carotene 15,15'-dioxygenase [Flavobacterium sp. N2820]
MKMYKVQKITVIASFLGLWLTSYLSDKNQLVLGFILIFTFGILHGANDLVLISQLENRKKQSFFKILISYIAIVLISALLFTKIPIVALTLFILVSAYHFGEQHWQDIEKNGNKIITKIFQFNYGLIILLLLFIFNKKEVIEIVFKITTVSIAEKTISIAFFIVLLLFLINTYILYKKSETFKNIIIEQLFYLVLLCLIFKVSSLIWGFTIYFIFWHSIPSLNDQIRFLYGKYSFTNFKKYFKSAFLYWIISLVGISILYFISKDLIIFDALFFSFLASITFPHAIVILKMYKK